MSSVLSERAASAVAVLRLNRPERRNALDSASLEELTGHLDALARDDDLGALVLSTTATTAFCAGADVGEKLDREGGVLRMELFARLYAALASFPAPVVCVCVGDVLGAGAEIAAASDIRVGADNLRIGWVGARLGVPVGPARLVPLVGLARATELLLTARTLGAREAVALGLLHRVVPAEVAEAEAIALAEEIARLPIDGIRRMKALLHRSEAIERRVAEENATLVEWQRHGAGLPQGRG